MSYSLALHIVGLVMWLGGMMVLTRVLTGFETNGPEKAPFAKIAKKLFFGFLVSGCVLTIATGFYQISVVGLSYYMKQGWFHGKLSGVILLVVVTLLVGKEVKKAQAGEALSRKRLTALHATTAALLIAIVIVTKVSTLP